MYFSPSAMTLEKYREAMRQLNKAGAQHPRGRRYHACLGTADKVQVFDVWDSQATFDAFGKTLVPILQAMGVEPGAPMVAEVHNVVIPPAKPAAAKAARKPAPRKASSRGAAKKKKR
jgi:hypothetical protein